MKHSLVYVITQLILKPEYESHQRRRIEFEVLFSCKNGASELKTSPRTNEDKIFLYFGQNLGSCQVSNAEIKL